MQTLHFTVAPTFFTELKRRVNNHFVTNQTPTTGNWRLYSKAIFLLVGHVTTYIWLFFFTPESGWFTLFLCAIMGLFSAGIGFNVMHDGSHGSFSNNKTLNKAAAFSLNILGGNDFLWNFKHNVLHHSFTNVDGADDDLEFRPLIRLCKSQEYKSWHRFQHIYFVGLYALLYMFWVFFTDYRKYFRQHICNFPIKGMTMEKHVLFWLSKLTFYTLFIIAPIIKFGWQDALLGFTVFAVVTGFTIGIVFQLAHTVEHTHFPLPSETGKIDNEWAIHQIQTTANFATKNKLITWFCGGLNFQVEHHLFPKISHVHYPTINKIVKETCAEFGLQYNEYPSLAGAVASHWRFLKSLSVAE